MKRAIKIIMPVLILSFLFCACSESETPNAATFVERYNSIENAKLSFSDIIGSEENGCSVYSFSETSETEQDKKILTKLFADDSKRLYECRIIMAKTDGKNKLSFSESDWERYFSAAVKTLCAFANLEKEKGESVLFELGAKDGEFFSKNGEKTLETGRFCLVSLSNDAAAEIIIYNTLLKKIGETEKPESRPLFDETTKIRTETVPHK